MLYNPYIHTSNRALVKVPSIITKTNEDRFSIDNPLLMDRMFEEDPVMEWLRHKGLNNLHDDIGRQFDGVTMPDGPRDTAGLLHSCPWKSRCQLLHCLGET